MTKLELSDFYNALVICNQMRAGDSRGNDQGFYQSFATAVRGNTWGLLYIGKKGSEMKI